MDGWAVCKKPTVLDDSGRVWTAGQTAGQTAGRTVADGRMGGRADGCTDRRTNGVSGGTGCCPSLPSYACWSLVDRRYHGHLTCCPSNSLSRSLPHAMALSHWLSLSRLQYSLSLSPSATIHSLTCSRGSVHGAGRNSKLQIAHLCCDRGKPVRNNRCQKRHFTQATQLSLAIPGHPQRSCRSVSHEHDPCSCPCCGALSGAGRISVNNSQRAPGEIKQIMLSNPGLQPPVASNLIKQCRLGPRYRLLTKRNYLYAVGQISHSGARAPMWDQ